ncbi:MAG: ribonuclease Rne/Rng family [Sphingomonas bacterium]|uniref:Rne/Rng family ribonuclease n=1 Tax=Sphingomonas bacterium TaxID=1895847 RepID=UPI002603FA6C|nr:Rne/Rng family ribonuclease [Sphingomonas bacterium]MDB5694704.1 ribonuclease Rne/Rng family [Sphingomonas bacterium]
MTTRMLIDARHREETRVAVVKGNRIEEFDFESAERKQLKGNIYLAKVTRVEPSLQAAFIDYGGNRHGFLAFSEIHPDYYQIPKEDREALLREEAEHAAEEAELRARHDADEDADYGNDGGDDDDDHHDEVTSLGDDEPDHAEDHDAEEEGTSKKPRDGARNGDEVEALRQRRMNLRRRYKIQDVIRRRQVLLVQVVKEERGNKGAALTTYLSLAGRYCVLMPNTSHGGGISRKISNAGDRKRLKTIMADLKLPPSMGCIVRTAGLQRTRTEIKRDFDYLARLWDGIRETTLESSAPALVYGDSDLMKRAIRDIYNAGVDEVIVEGEEGYRQAKEFMRLLMPSHARRVKQYADAVPLYQRAGVEDQLAAMYNPVVQLKSGGYLVINPTEALVAIDINSGRSTREHNIEQTATATNLEAAQEIARQLRLRDMAGLVVIDFIDMDNGSNVRKVEKAMKEALKDDRARIQVGRISSFGLMEMSRQRLRTGVLEASTRMCPHCEGTGLVRTAASAGLSALRMIEDEAARGRGSLLTLRASQEAAIYVLNRKRADIAEIEERYGVQVQILPDREEEGARMVVEAAGPPPAHAPRIEALVIEEEDDFEDEIPEEIEIEEEDADEEEADETQPRQREERPARDENGEGGRKRRRRRGRRRGGRPEEGEREEGEREGTGEAGDEVGEEADADGDTADRAEPEFVGEQPREDGDGSRRRGRRRGRRGGRRPEGETAGEAEGELPTEAELPLDDADVDGAGDSGPELIEAADAGYVVSPLDLPTREEDAKPKTRRRSRSRAAAENVTLADEAPAEAPVTEAAEPAGEEPTFVGEAPVKPRRSRRKAAPTDAGPADSEAGETPVEPAPELAIEPPVATDAEEKPKRRSRRKAPVQSVEAIEAQTGGEPVASAVEAPPAPVNETTGDTDNATLATGQDGTLAEDAEADAGPARRGWWQRTFGA